jgi:hypothetical protein
MQMERELKEEQLYMDLVMETRRDFGKGVTEAEYLEYKEEQKKK